MSGDILWVGGRDFRRNLAAELGGSLLSVYLAAATLGCAVPTSAASTSAGPEAKAEFDQTGVDRGPGTLEGAEAIAFLAQLGAYELCRQETTGDCAGAPAQVAEMDAAAQRSLASAYLTAAAIQAGWIAAPGEGLLPLDPASDPIAELETTLPDADALYGLAAVFQAGEALSIGPSLDAEPAAAGVQTVAYTPEHDVADAIGHAEAFHFEVGEGASALLVQVGLATFATDDGAFALTTEGWLQVTNAKGTINALGNISRIVWPTLKQKRDAYKRHRSNGARPSHGVRYGRDADGKRTIMPFDWRQ